MDIRHPEALDGVGGECPDRVVLGGKSYECGDGETFEVSEAQANALAARYGVDVESIAVDDEAAESDDSDESDDEPDTIDAAIERGECPWCDDYEGEHVGQHASSAHPEAWSEYKE